MESCSSIIVKVISCRDLKAFNFFQKLSVYVLVSIAHEDPENKNLKQSQQQRTPTDGEGDGNPDWNHEFRFDLDDDGLIKDHDHFFIHFELHAEAVFGDKVLGEVRVPFKDLMDEFNGVVRFVSYEVRGTDGKSNGVINFSYMINNAMRICDNEMVSNIDGYSVVHQPTFEAIYPNLEIESCYSPSSDCQYPALDLSNQSHETYSPSVQVQHISHEVQYPPSYENYYRPPSPPRDNYYPPPPPPPPHGNYYPPPHDNYYPPLPPGHDEGFYPPRPPPPPMCPWAFSGGYD